MYNNKNYSLSEYILSKEIENDKVLAHQIPPVIVTGRQEHFKNLSVNKF